MKIDIMFIVKHFQKEGDGFFSLSIHYFLYAKNSSDEHAHDAKVPTPYKSETDHHVWQASFGEN